MPSSTEYNAGEPHQGSVVLYLRVSTGKQGADGLGVDAQRAACFDYLNGGSWKVIAEFVEVESGKKDNRTKLLEAIELCKKKKATLVVAKLDRLSRDVEFTAHLMKSKVDFVAADMPMANTLTIHIMAAMAQHEREMVSVRTKAALQALKAKGKVLGAAPAALKAAGVKGNEVVAARAKLHADNVYPIIQDIKERGGCTTLREIANALEARGIKTHTGRTSWHPQQVSNVIRRAEE
jgi:DNA invertase Pin-like site-specific DNA recombinase